MRLELTGFVRFGEGQAGAVHSHPFWELIFIGSGNGTYRLEGKSRACRQDDLLLIPSGAEHQFTAGPSGSMEHLYLGFSFHLTAPASKPRAISGVFPPGPLIYLIRTELREIHLRVRKHGERALLEARCSRFLPVVSRVIGLLNVSKHGDSWRAHGRDPSPVQMAKDIIHSNLDSKLSIPELARHFCLSPRYFGEMFKKGMGMSLKECQQKLRMTRAWELLTESELSVTAVAEEVGIDNLPYFSRLFKKEFHVSPSRVRQRGNPKSAAPPRNQ